VKKFGGGGATGAAQGSTSALQDKDFYEH